MSSVLVAYAQLQPWRGTVHDHDYSFRRYGTRPYEYVNLAVPGLGRAYARRRYDAVLWHNTVLAWLRWAPEEQQRGLLGRARSLRATTDCHVALPQDEPYTLGARFAGYEEPLIGPLRSFRLQASGIARDIACYLEAAS